MVDVSSKQETLRQAEAEAVLWVGSEVMNAIRDGRTPKGNILETARIAGVMGAKRTSDLIPLCHPLNLTHVSVDMNHCTNSRLNRCRDGGAHRGFGCGFDAVRHAESSFQRNASRRTQALGKVWRA
jgi:hypothetical protein